MEPKLPFYMMYPNPFLFDDDRVDDWDDSYMKSMYPEMARRMVPYVENECDRMEYEGSMIYDEYPDKLQLRLICGRVYQDFLREEKMEEDANLRDLAELMVYHELWKRRCKHRRNQAKRLW